MLIRCCLKDLFTLHKLAEKLSTDDVISGQEKDVNTHGRLRCERVRYEYITRITRSFVDFSTSRKCVCYVRSRTFCRPKSQIFLPFHVLVNQWNPCPLIYLTETWKRHPFRAEPPRFGHYRECPPDLQLAYTLHTCTLENPMLINSFRAFHTRVYVSCFRTKRITRRPLFDPVRFKKRRNLNSRTCNYLSHFLRLINVFRSFFDEKYQFLPLWLQVHVASLKIFA